MNDRKYQVALSFAGEQRDYVKEVARNLQSRSIAVFYDDFEEVGLWGRSGAEAFHEVYADESDYVVMFISAAYVEKAWPIHERRSALSRMMREQREYILPVRFDDSDVPGLPADTIYVSAGDHTPAQLATLIAQKLGVQPLARKASEVPPPRMTSLTGEVAFDYSSFNGRYVIGSGVLEFETKWAKASDIQIHAYNDPPSIHGVALARGCESISEVANAASLDYTSRSRTPSVGEIVVLRNTEGFYAAVQIIEIKDDSRQDDRDELRFRYAIQSDGSDDFGAFVGLGPVSNLPNGLARLQELWTGALGRHYARVSRKTMSVLKGLDRGRCRSLSGTVLAGTLPISARRNHHMWIGPYARRQSAEDHAFSRDRPQVGPSVPRIRLDQARLRGVLRIPGHR